MPENISPAPGARPCEHPLVSVIVSLGDLDIDIRPCMEALINQDMDQSWEIILVLEENHILKQWTTRQYPQVITCPCRHRQGPGGQRNLGMAKARGDILVFTDADCIMQKDWLKNITRAVHDNNGGPAAGWTCTSEPCHASKAMDLAEHGMLRPAGRIFIKGIWGSNMAVSRALVEKSGTKFATGIYGTEETVFINGLGLKNPSVILEPAAVVKDTHSASMPRNNRTIAMYAGRIYRLGFGSGFLRKKHSLRGSIFSRYSFLVFLLVPARIVFALARGMRIGPGAFFKTVTLLPLCTYYWIHYLRGYISGQKEAENS